MLGPAIPSGCGASQGIETWATDSGTRVMCINSDGLISISTLESNSLAPAASSSCLFHPWQPSPSSLSQHTTPRQGLKGPIERFRMSSDRRCAVAGGRDALMQLWDVETSQVCHPSPPAPPALHRSCCAGHVGRKKRCKRQAEHVRDYISSPVRAVPRVLLCILTPQLQPATRVVYRHVVP